MKYLDLDTWPRRRHFDYFRQYAQPFFSITASVDVTALFERSRGPGAPAFSALYHHAALLAANRIECFRYRLDGEHVAVHDIIHGGTTVLLGSGSFTFCYFEFHEDLAVFAEAMRESIDAAQRSSGPLDPQDERTDLIHFTSIPWVRFTGVMHPRRPVEGDSIPKIAFGKATEDRGRMAMPVAVDAHHALVDGLHVGLFFEQMQVLASTRA